jgi:hypothetical protein
VKSYDYGRRNDDTENPNAGIQRFADPGQDILSVAEGTEQADVVEVLRRLIAQAREREQPSTSGGALDRILARATNLGVEDLAEHHDYYLYGVEKP